MDAASFRISGEVEIIDVRDPQEWATGHLETAMSIPLSELNDRLGQLRTGRPLIAVCKTGVRSKQAAELLRSKGFDADSLEGGMQALAGKLPLTTGGAQPASAPDESGAGAQTAALSPELARLSDTMFEILLAMQERFGDRERTEQEELAFVREYLMSRGRPAEEFASIITPES